MIATITVSGRWSSGSAASRVPAVGDQLAHRVEQRGAAARLQVEGGYVGDRPVGVDDVVVVVELRQRDPALAGRALLLLDERREAALGVGLDRLHGAGAVEQEVDVGEVWSVMGALLQVVGRRGLNRIGCGLGAGAGARGPDLVVVLRALHRGRGHSPVVVGVGAEGLGAGQPRADGVLGEPGADPGRPQAGLAGQHRLRHRLVDQLGEPVGCLTQVGERLVGLEALGGLQCLAYGGELLRIRCHRSIMPQKVR